MKIINSEIVIIKPEMPSSEYFETELKKAGLDFIRWAIVAEKKDKFLLNVSHKVAD